MRIVLLLLVFFVSSLADAADKDKKLRTVQDKIKQVTQDLSRLRRQQKKADKNLQRIEQQYGKVSRTVRDLQVKVRQKRQRLNEIEREIQVQKGWLATQEELLAGQMRAAYALGRQEPLKLLFNQQDITRTSRVMRYYQYFNQARIQNVEQVDASLQLLARLQKEKEQDVQAIQNLSATNAQKQKILASTKQEREQLLSKIKKNVKHSRSSLSKLKKNERQLKRLIRALQQATEGTLLVVNATKPFKQLKGQLTWPVRGKLVRSFASSRGEGKWSGVLLRAKEGDNVRSIAHGQVVFSDWFKGYGLLLIVKHDKNYMSLYAFNQSLYREKGDWIEAGDIIATVGKSGGREQAGLYFEIRKRNKPINPALWCKLKR